MSEVLSVKSDELLELRLVGCPACNRQSLVKTAHVQGLLTCACGKAFYPAEHIITGYGSDGYDLYSIWRCPKCQKLNLVPRYAVYLPVSCVCGQHYPRLAEGISTRWSLQDIEDAFVGNDPLFHEKILSPLHAAMRYEYEVQETSKETYHVRNPTTGSCYETIVSVSGENWCSCDHFTMDGYTCIHIEYIRLKRGLFSMSMALLESKQFAYAWFDKACVPPRIRIGWSGPLDIVVRELVRNVRPITGIESLKRLQTLFAQKRIEFFCLTSARFANCLEQSLEIDAQLTQLVDIEGPAFLRRVMPSLYGYQVDGAVFLAGRQRALLLDEMGLGKTLQAIAASLLLKRFAKIESCLLVVPKSVMSHWKSEIRRFCTESITQVVAGPCKRASQYRANTFFKLVTLETLRRDFPCIGDHQLVIVDEVHKARNIQTIASRVLRNLDAQYFFGLSGTPIENSLEDLYNLLRILRCGSLESPLEFTATHLICDAFGKAKQSLHSELFFVRHADRVLRRLKKNVVKGLPQMQCEEVELPLTPLQEQMAAPLLSELEMLCRRLKERYDLEDFLRRRWLVNRLVELSDSTALLDATTNESSKLTWLRQFLTEQCIRAREKVVVFTRWTRSQQIICKLCTQLDIKWVSLSGGNTGDEREQAVRQFSQDRETLVFISTDAGGVGINLQAARTIVNFEPAWNPSTDAQRLQRVHRIGQPWEVRAVLPTTFLDQMFVRITHPRKQYGADRLDALSNAAMVAVTPAWEEIVPVIDFLRASVGSDAQLWNIPESPSSRTEVLDEG